MTAGLFAIPLLQNHTLSPPPPHAAQPQSHQTPPSRKHHNRQSHNQSIPHASIPSSVSTQNRRMCSLLLRFREDYAQLSKKISKMICCLLHMTMAFTDLLLVLDVPLVHPEGGGYRPGALSGRTSCMHGQLASPDVKQAMLWARNALRDIADEVIKKCWRSSPAATTQLSFTHHLCLKQATIP